MPIRGISDQVRLPRLAKVHLGYKIPVIDRETRQQKIDARTKEVVTRPVAADHFVFPAEMLAQVHAAYGGISGRHPATGVEQYLGPREITVMFPNDDIDMVFPHWLKAYKSSCGLFCQGDGEKAKRRKMVGDRIQQEWVETPCTYEACPIYQAGDCAETASLHVVLPNLPGLGTVQIDTGSKMGMLNILARLNMVQAATGGRIRGIPMRLRLDPQTMHYQGRDSMVATQPWILQLFCDMHLKDAAALRSGEYPHYLVDDGSRDQDEAPVDISPKKGAAPEGVRPFPDAGHEPAEATGRPVASGGQSGIGAPVRVQTGAGGGAAGAMAGGPAPANLATLSRLAVAKGTSLAQVARAVCGAQHPGELSADCMEKVRLHLDSLPVLESVSGK